MLANLANLAHPTDGALVLGVILGSIECTLLVAGAAVNGCVASCAHVKLGELVELDLHGVVRVALALSLGSLGLG